MDAYHILVIVLSVLLGIILLIGVVVGVFMIKIIKDIRYIISKASQAADNIEHAANLFKNTSGIAAATKIIGNAVELFKKARK
jgi:hypothetical protein